MAIRTPAHLAVLAGVCALVLAGCATTETFYNTNRDLDTVSVISTATNTVRAAIREGTASVMGAL